MTDKASRTRRPRDVNQLARSIVDDATNGGQPRDDTPMARKKDPSAVALGRRGGLKGGRARADRLSPEERKVIARHAAQARWKRDDS